MIKFVLSKEVNPTGIVFRKSFGNDLWQVKAFFKTNKHYLAKQISKKCVFHGRLGDTLQSKFKANGYF